MDELTERELAELALLEGIAKELRARLSKTKKGSLRARFDHQALTVFVTDGTQKKELRAFGERVGSYSVVTPKPKKPERAEQFTVTDTDRLAAVQDSDFSDFIAEWLDNSLEYFAELYFFERGELLDGCELVEVEDVADPPSPYVRLTVDSSGVARMLHSVDGGALGYVERLLEGGER